MTVDGPGRLDGTLTISAKGAVTRDAGRAGRCGTRRGRDGVGGRVAPGAGALPQRVRFPSAATVRAPGRGLRLRRRADAASVAARVGRVQRGLVLVEVVGAFWRRWP